jgi:hypothetical protein
MAAMAATLTEATAVQAQPATAVMLATQTLLEEALAQQLVPAAAAATAVV